MNVRSVLRSWMVLLFMALVAAPPAHSQIGDLDWRLHGGVVLPIAGFGDYFKLGPSVGVDVGYPLNDRLSLKLDLDMDWLQTTDIYPTPATNLWRYRVGVETDLLEDQGNNAFLLQALVGAGATTFRSKQFWLQSRQPYTFEGERLDKTSLTGMGGVRVGMRTPDGITWWLTGKLNWSPLDDDDQEALRELARNDLDLVGAATSFSITLGFSLP